MSVMLVLEYPRVPTLEEAAEELNIDVGNLDIRFGVCLVDPIGNLYTVLTRENVVSND